MGYSKLPNEAVDLITEVSVHAWRLYCYLLRRYNRETGQCNPSATTCAKAINVSLNHIFKLRRELFDAGLVRFDYGAVTFLIGSEDIYKDSNPIHTDRADDLNPIHTDRGPYPHGYPTLSTQIGNPIHTDNAYKEEPDELTRRINQTNRTRESADAPRAEPLPSQTRPSGTKKKSTAKVKSSLKVPKEPVPPAIEALKEITRIYPHRSTWGRFVGRLGTNFDRDRLRECGEVWLARGNKQTNHDGIIDWYEKGIPEQGGKSNGRSRKSDGEKLSETLDRWQSVADRFKGGRVL